MGRKSQAGTREGDEKQLQILDAAASVFMKLGFSATSMDDISESYGATKGIIYYHFRSKTALFFAVQRRAMALTREAIEPWALAPGTAPERLQHMATAHTLLMMEHLDYLRVAAQGLELHLSGRTSEEERSQMKVITELRDANERLYLQVLNEGVSAGQFRPMDTRVAVKPLLGALNWTSRWYHARRGESRSDREKLAAEISDFAVHAFLPNGAQRIQ